MSRDKRFFTIGEFAEVCGIKKQTLLHYDDIGLLKPRIRSDTGYRYYAMSAFEDLFAIKSLQDLGLSLKEIQVYLLTKNSDQFLRVLKTQLDKINQQILSLNTIKYTVLEKIRLANTPISLNKMYFESREREAILISPCRKKCTFPSREFSVQIMSHINRVKQLGLKGAFSTGICFSINDIENSIYNEVGAFFSRIPEGMKIQAESYLEKGIYLSLNHMGNTEESSHVYPILLDFISANELMVHGDFFVESLLDSHSVTDYKDYIDKISLRVS